MNEGVGLFGMFAGVGALIGGGLGVVVGLALRRPFPRAPQVQVVDPFNAPVDGSQIQMCGGCGCFLPPEEIAECKGEKCERYLRTQ